MTEHEARSSVRGAKIDPVVVSATPVVVDEDAMEVEEGTVMSIQLTASLPVIGTSVPINFPLILITIDDS